VGRRLRGLVASVLLATLLQTACGDGDEPEAVSVSTVTTTATVTVASTVTETETVPADTSGEAEPALSTPTFQMPSRNIGCRFGFRRLRCDILSGLEPEPDETCDFDWVGVDMGLTGPAAANCGSDTVYEAGAPTLAYGSTWSRAGIVCESDENALTCTNPEGHAFALARGSWSVS
jgi:Family of unknown function (DUF6636)